MRHMLLTTAMVVPLSLSVAVAQEAQEAEPEADVQVIEPEVVEPDAEEAGEAVEGAVEQTGEAVEGAAEEAGEVAQEGVEAAEDAAEDVEVQELDVEVIEADEAPAAEGEAPVAEGEAPAAPEEVIMREQAPNELRVDWITNTTVRSPDGETIGDIDDLILDRENGQLTAAIIGVGGFLGIGEKRIAVNWNELQVDYDANEITLNITREQAEAVPEYVFRDQEQPPAPAAAPATGVGTTGGMEPGVGAGAPPAPAPAGD